MKKVIERIHKRTTEYSHPSQATTTANALDLLSSGIYTEEERFVFELLQNAVDSYEPNASSGLDIKIIVKDNKLMFLHNGQPFSERDLEGLCDIGNGNKMSDAKKIGYKGIGFKSVFMHSKRVIVVTAGTAFKFDEEACKLLAQNKGSEYKDVKMPWQIIPIPIDKPSLSEFQEYTVATILEVNNGAKLLGKVKKLLSDVRFLLFLNVGNLKMTLLDGETEILSLSKNQNGDLLTLSKNGEPQNKWLIYSKSVRLTPEVKIELVHDTKTPDKLKKSDAVEISFAIALDKDDRIIPLTDAVVYTYLPTSYSFGFSFIVNANFITDAGRQQLIKDCEWNKFIFSQIPALYLNWIKDVVAPKYGDWHQILLPIINRSDDLSSIYSKALNDALVSIPFVRTEDNVQCYVNDVYVDKIGLKDGLESIVYQEFLHRTFSSSINAVNRVAPSVGQSLSIYGIKVLSLSNLSMLLADSYCLKKMENAGIAKFVSWLRDISQNLSTEFISELKVSKLLPTDNGNLSMPQETFLPSAYREDNEMASAAKVLEESFFNLCTEDLISWLKEIGVQEMSNISVIDTVLCNAGYINGDNAIDVVKFIFNANKKEAILDTLSYRLQNLRYITKKGNLKSIRDLYLSDEYRPSLMIEKLIDSDIFISEKYITSDSDVVEWRYFFEKLGINVDFTTNTKSISVTEARNNTFLAPTIKESEKIDYPSYNGNTYYFSPCNYQVNNFAIMPINPPISMLQFCKYFWTVVLTRNKPTYSTEYINGVSGFIGRTLLLRSFVSGKNYLDWILNNEQRYPTSMGTLEICSDILENTDYNIATFGKYFPVIDINGGIDDTWNNVITFKKELSLTDYLQVLSRISEDNSQDRITENKDKICRIYDRIADGGYDFSEGSNDFNLLKNWGKTHKLLSKDLLFENPSNLNLLSSRITGVKIENQVFHQKYQENERFAAMMIALGVNMISDHRVEGLDEAIEKPDIKNRIQGKLDFLTVISTSESFSEERWDELRTKMAESIDNLNFLQTDSIRVVYGTQAIEKPIYVKDNNLYFVGTFSAGIQEFLTADIVRLLGLHKGDQTTFLTILRMSDFEEIKDYLSQKGYDTSFLKEPELPKTESSLGGAVLGGENPSYGGLTKDQMRAALVEAKDSILAKLSCEGYDTSSAQWDGWTCVDGIQKNGEEFPLVIRSNKSGRNTILSDIDWNQLMRPNAMFVVNTSNGIGTINFKQLLKSKENITIRFGSDNIEIESRISRLAQAFSFFKGMQFDFESYVTPVINRWQSFMAPEKNTGELPEASDTSFLPE